IEETYLFTATSTQLDVTLKAATPNTGYFDDISIKPAPNALIMRGVVADDWASYTYQTDIVHDGGTIDAGWIGEQLVTNGGFDDASGWSLGAGWGIAGGVATQSLSGSALLSQSLAIPAVYLFEGDVVLDTATGFRSFTGASYYTVTSASGKFSAVVEHQNSYGSLLCAMIDGTGSIDNVSAKHLLEIA
ncbi:MAG: hypothetical protein GY822_17265, partial [Deltaproteobacteria bacterium]|nr:hypothetical protein [Deltaproteobacteria bacterium]